MRNQQNLFIKRCHNTKTLTQSVALLSLLRKYCLIIYHRATQVLWADRWVLTLHSQIKNQKQAHGIHESKLQHSSQLCWAKNTTQHNTPKVEAAKPAAKEHIKVCYKTAVCTQPPQKLLRVWQQKNRPTDPTCFVLTGHSHGGVGMKRVLLHNLWTMYVPLWPQFMML